MWTNLGQDQFTKTSKKLFTYGVTAVILCASFWAIYGLSFFQLAFFKNKTQNNLFNQATSIFISLLISAINIAIKRKYPYICRNYENINSFIEKLDIHKSSD